MAATTMETMTAEILSHWRALGRSSGSCYACDKPLAATDQRKVSIATTLLISDGMDYEEFFICDRHRNLSAAARKAWKRWEGIDRGPVKLAA